MPNSPISRLLRLLKTLYGLKQASNRFNAKLHGEILKLGYTQCTGSDECIFIRRSASGGMLVIGTFVDDITRLCSTLDLPELDADMAALGKIFTLKDLGDAEHVLGMRITRDRANRTLTLCLLYTSPSPRDGLLSRMPSSA